MNNKKNDIIDLLSKMDEMVKQAKMIPFSDNCIVNKEEILLLVSIIMDSIPNELKQAKWLLEQQKQLINQAHTEYEKIIAQGESRVAIMIDEHEITRRAQSLASTIMEDANSNAETIKENAIQYVESRLEEVEETLTSVMVRIQKDKKSIKSSQGE